MVDEDTRAFNAIMAAFALPKGNDTEKAARKQAVQDATKYAIEVPFKVMELSLQSLPIIKAMAEIGNPNSVTDAGVGALCARTAVLGAFLNVKINAGGLDDKTFATDIVQRGEAMVAEANKLEQEIWEVVNGKI